MRQQGAVTPAPLLKLKSRLHRGLTVRLILLRLSARRGINLLERGYRKRRILRVLTLIILIKINQLRLTAFQLRDNQPHLQPPVAQMHVPDHPVSHKTSDPPYALPDNRRAQMTHMKRLCDIGSAIINHNCARIVRFLTAIAPLVRLHIRQISGQTGLIYF